MKECIRKEITVLKVLIWGRKLLVLQSQIEFYGSTDKLLSNKIFNHKTDNLLPQMTILSTVITYFLLKYFRDDVTKQLHISTTCNIRAPDKRYIEENSKILFLNTSLTNA